MTTKWRNVPARFAGGAAGVLNTIRQTGSALGSAVVLAVLQTRLADGHGYVSALRAAMIVPIAALLIGAALALALRPGNPGRPGKLGKPGEGDALVAEPTARS